MKTKEAKRFVTIVRVALALISLLLGSYGIAKLFGWAG